MSQPSNRASLPATAPRVSNAVEHSLEARAEAPLGIGFGGATDETRDVRERPGGEHPLDVRATHHTPRALVNGGELAADGAGDVRLDRRVCLEHRVEVVEPRRAVQGGERRLERREGVRSDVRAAAEQRGERRMAQRGRAHLTGELSLRRAPSTSRAGELELRVDCIDEQVVQIVAALDVRDAYATAGEPLRRQSASVADRPRTVGGYRPRRPPVRTQPSLLA